MVNAACAGAGRANPTPLRQASTTPALSAYRHTVTTAVLASGCPHPATLEAGHRPDQTGVFAPDGKDRVGFHRRW
ncbi:hypothetical protein GCM10011576_48970 [Micromonospora parathelypteridis]|nr:hypothetical protein GCM10011576_48970 [Micromonospora parathelypteridis]